jgi:hypothetical protein
VVAPELDDEAGDADPRQTTLQEDEEHCDGHGRECVEEEFVEQLPIPLTGEIVDDEGPERAERQPAGEDHRCNSAPLLAARPAPVNKEQRESDGDDVDAGRTLEDLEASGEPVLVRDLE